MTNQPSLNRRLERHRRIDGELQARARPVSFERKSAEEDGSALQIRQWVEHREDEMQDLSKRLFSGLDGDDSPPRSGNSNGSNRGSSGPGGSDESGGSSGNTGGSGSGGSGSGSGGDSSGGSGSSSSSSSSGNNGGLGRRPGGSDTSATATSTHSSKTGLLDGLFPDRSTTTSSQPTSTSSTSTRSSTTSSRIATETLTSSSTSSSTTSQPSTSVAYVTSSPLPSLNNAAATASETSKSSDDGPGVGPIIGIVAGSLAGVAILAALIGFLFKKFGRKEDPYEADPFDRDSFRRHSAMLPDTFDDDEGNPEMSEAHHNMSAGTGPFADEHEYVPAAAMGAGAAAAGFTARNESGGPRPPTMFQKHMNAPAAQVGMSDAPPVPSVGAIYATGAEPTPQLPPMAFGGSDPYSLAGVGRPNFDNNINNPYGYLDRSYSGSHSSPQGQEHYVDSQEYAHLDRAGSNGSSQNGGPVPDQNMDGEYSAYGHHDTAGRPGTAEGRSGTPDLPNVQQTYAMADASVDENRVASPHRMMSSPQHMSQDFLSNGIQQQYEQQYQQQYASGNVDPYAYRQHSESPSPPQQPLQVRNLLPNPHEQAQHGGQRPISAVSSVADEDAAYGGVW